MIDSRNADMQIYDIYDVIYTPWWQKSWFIGILCLLCIFLCFLGFVAYRKYKRKSVASVDFFVVTQQQLDLYKNLLEKSPDKVDAQELYTSLIAMLKKAYFIYEHADFFHKTGTDLKEALRHRGVEDESLYAFLDAAENARFSKHASGDLLLTHLEYMQSFLIKIVQNKANKPK